MTLEVLLIYSHTTQIEAILLAHIADITHTLYLICTNVDITEETSRVIWCQMTTRLCHIIECSLSQQLKQNNLVGNNITTKVQESARALQSLHQIVLTLRDTYGLPFAMPPVMAFWATCDVTIQALSDVMLRATLKIHIARQYAANVYRYLCATSPSPQELSALVHSPHMKVTSTPPANVQTNNPSNIALNTYSDTSRSSILSQIQSPNGSQLSTQRRTIKTSASSVPNKISFVLVGFQYLVSGATGGDFSNATIR